MKVQEIGQLGEASRNFIHSIKSPQSKILYSLALRDFMKYRNTTRCEELLQGDTKIIQSNIIDYILQLKDVRRLASATVATRVSALKHFYKMNDIILNWDKISSFQGEHVSVVKDKPYNKAEIARLLEKADHRDKVIVLLMSSGGLRRGSISSIRLRNLSKIDKYRLYQITVYENTSSEYFTFCTPECREAIDNYLEYRKRYGEKLRPEAPLIREQFHKEDSFRVTNPRVMSTEVVRHTIDKLAYDSGIRSRPLPLQKQELPRKRYDTMISHGLRKFFDTTATVAGLNPLYVELLMGHKLGLKGAYFRPTPRDLLEGNDKMIGYVGVIDALTIGEENRLRLENQQIKQRNDYLERDKDEVISLRKELQPLLELKKTLIREGVLKEC